MQTCLPARQGFAKFDAMFRRDKNNITNILPNPAYRKAVPPLFIHFRTRMTRLPAAGRD
jgi:hypothetical protein